MDAVRSRKPLTVGGGGGHGSAARAGERGNRRQRRANRRTAFVGRGPGAPPTGQPDTVTTTPVEINAARVSARTYFTILRRRGVIIGNA